jgi:hypothetical protein
VLQLKTPCVKIRSGNWKLFSSLFVKTDWWIKETNSSSVFLSIIVSISLIATIVESPLYHQTNQTNLSIPTPNAIHRAGAYQTIKLSSPF